HPRSRRAPRVRGRRRLRSRRRRGPPGRQLRDGVGGLGRGLGEPHDQEVSGGRVQGGEERPRTAAPSPTTWPRDSKSSKKRVPVAPALTARAPSLSDSTPL